MKKLLSYSFGFLLLASVGSVSAYYYQTSYQNQTVCTTDAYQCADGTWVGRTGSNCQFVCPSTNNSYNQSYSYTSGCYTYYYNGNTRTTSVTSYNCTNYHTNTYTYSYPVTTSYAVTPYYYPSSQYHTYKACNGGWVPSYQYNKANCTGFWDSVGLNSGYSTYQASYTTGAHYHYSPYGYTYTTYTPTSYTSNCYYVNGYQVCQ